MPGRIWPRKGTKRHKKPAKERLCNFLCVFVPFCGHLFRMPKRPNDAEEDKPKAITTYTIKLDDAQMEKLRAATAAKNWEQVEVPYARFAFKGPKVNVTAYTSGKV